MKEEEKKKSLTNFQALSFKTYKTLGFNADNANTIFGVIIEMRNLVLAAEKEDTVLLHKHMGECAAYVANYATINSISLAKAIGSFGHLQMTEKTEMLDLEYYLEKIKDDLSFVTDMQEKDKEEFVQKCWVCIFPEDYHDDFIKVDRILNTNIEDNKIKYPEKFSTEPRTGSRFGME